MSIIRELNDTLRVTLSGGRVVMTDTVAAMSESDRAAAFHAMMGFNQFNEDNDPYGEHDCAIFTVGKQRFLFKISYYDKSLERGSEDPSNPDITTRVLHLMLASEY